MENATSISEKYFWYMWLLSQKHLQVWRKNTLQIMWKTLSVLRLIVQKMVKWNFLRVKQDNIKVNQL